MRLSKLGNLFSLTKYRRLQRDFRNPLTALLAASGLLKRTFRLHDKANHPYCINRNDQAIWQAYFERTACEVIPEDGLFRIVPSNPAHPGYRIAGCDNCFTHQPQRWNTTLYNSPLAQQLEQAERRVFSQHGEDGILEYLFRFIPSSKPTIIEFGAYDGVYMSNSRNLIYHHGWEALLIEADNRFYKDLHNLYQGHANVVTLNSMVTPENINRLFADHAIPRNFDVLSIDIDSIDYYVWEALSDFTPKVVVIEYNSTILPDIEYIVEPDKVAEYGGTSREGASLLALYNLGKRKGYELVYSELYGANLFFVHQDYLQYFAYQPLSPEALYQPPQFGVLAGGKAPNGRGYL
jgi:hypothetical protein